MKADDLGRGMTNLFAGGRVVVTYLNGLGTYTAFCLDGTAAAEVHDIITATDGDTGPHVTDHASPAKAIYALAAKWE